MKNIDLQQDATLDNWISGGLWAFAGGSLALTLMFGRVAPKQVKYAGLLVGLGASVASAVYEQLDSTKIVRAQNRQARNQGLKVKAAQFANSLNDDILAIRGEAEQQTAKTLAAMPKAVQQSLTMGMGTPMDANPATQTIDAPAKPVSPTVASPVYVAKKSGASDQLQVYIQFLHRQIISKLGKRPSSLLLHGGTRDGKSTLCQVLIYCLALNAIAKGNRLICTALIPHGIDKETAKTDPFHPLWNGLPVSTATMDGRLESGALKVTPKKILPYLRELDTELDMRITDDDYSWSKPQSQTPAMCLVLDDAANQFRRMDDAERAEAATIIAHIAQDGSKYGVFVWMLMHDSTKDRTGIDPAAWASMQTIWGYKSLRDFGPKTEETKQARAQMQQSAAKMNAGGYWNEDLGYMPPPPLKSVRELLITWKEPPVDRFDAQISMVNMLRERITEPEKLGDDALIANAIEFSTFTRDEVVEFLPYVRVLIGFEKSEYEKRVADMRQQILDSTD